MERKLRNYTNKELNECSDLELFNALLNYTADEMNKRGYNQGKKKLYYISAEFLIGKLLSNNLINLGLYEEVRKELADAGKDITVLEEYEYEPSSGVSADWPRASRTVLRHWACLRTVSVLRITVGYSVRRSRTTSRTKHRITG